MPHVAAKLRQAVALQLAGLPTTGANVFLNRTQGTPLHEGEYPGIVVSGRGEQITEITLGGEVIQRDMRLSVTVMVKTNDGDVEDTLDQIRLEVETALNPRLSIDTTTVALLYTGLSDPETDESLDEAVMIAEMSYACTVFTSKDRPDLLQQ